MAATTQTSTQGGYNLEFVETLPSHFICLICSFVAKHPYKTRCCGKIYCKSCLEHLRNKSEMCPNCHEISTSISAQKSHSQILELRVRCTNASRGCTWLGRVRELEGHCYECPKEVVRCEYYEIGCRTKLLREEQDEHKRENLSSHFGCALETVLILRKSQSELRKEVQEIRQTYQPRTPVAVFKMSNFSQYKAANKCWYSPSFLSHPGGYKMCLRVDANGIGPFQGTYVSVFVCLMQGENDSSLIWPFRGRVTVQLLNQIRDGDHCRGLVEFESDACDECNSRVTCVVSGTGRGWPQFVPQSTLGFNSKTNSQYVKEDSLYFRMSKVDVHPLNKPWLSCTA